MSDKPWKRFERKVAEKFKGQRVIRPDWGKPDLDVVAEPFGIECKYRKEFSFEKALSEAEEIVGDKSRPLRSSLLPIAVCQHPGERDRVNVAFRFSILEELGLVGSIKSGVKGNIIIVPLQMFLDMLDEGGVAYGKRD